MICYSQSELGLRERKECRGTRPVSSTVQAAGQSVEGMLAARVADEA